MKWLKLIGFLPAALMPAQASAWDNLGHMLVAAVAYDKLTPAVRSRAVELLRLNPDYNGWVMDVPTQDRDKVTFLMAATWPDAIKDRSDYHDGPEGPGSGAHNAGYQDHSRHKHWHFIDVPFSPDGTPLRQPKAPNAQTQISAFRQALASGAPDSEKSYDLVWLLHLVGDVHQPLHATSRFTQHQTDGDVGGNEVEIHTAAECPNHATNLHSFWDEVLGVDNKPADAIRGATALAPADTQLAAIADEHVWIQESFEDAKTVAYAPPVGVGHGPFTLDGSYCAKAVELARKRIALAGARLANLLNANLR